MSDGPTPEQSLPPASRAERMGNPELGRTNLGVFAYDSLKHLGDHFSAALEEQAKSKAEGKPETWGQGWHHEQMRRWSKGLYLNIGISQGRGFIDERTANGLVSLAEDTPGLSQGVVEGYLDGWNGTDKDRVREKAYGRHDLTESAVQILNTGRSEIQKAGDYSENSEDIIKRVDQASLYLRGITEQS